MFQALASGVIYFKFPSDMNEIEVDINRLNNQNLVKYFEEEWSVYTQ
jgi:predicted membrane-bound spermidine synthase